MSISEKLKEVEYITTENNRMLKGIIKWINAYSLHIQNDNTADFGRNILANLISNFVDGNVRR